MPKLTTYLSNITGTVLSILPNSKALITFNRHGEDQTALLHYEKLKYNGLDAPANGNISDYLQEGTILTFDCQKYNGRRSKQWFDWVVVVAWIRSNELTSCSKIGFSGLGFEGKCNIQGTVVEVAHHKGVLSFEENGSDERVLFSLNKLYLYGKKARKLLKEYEELEEGSKLMFDAVPCNKEETAYNCRWFATRVWNGSWKPIAPYNTAGGKKKKANAVDLKTEIRLVSLNPRSTFIRGFGQILHVLDAEFGLALGSISPNRWDSILFHRSSCFLFKMCLSGHDLTKIFKEGDKISFIAVPAPRKFITQWIANSVSVYRDPSVKDNYDPMISLL